MAYRRAGLWGVRGADNILAAKDAEQSREDTERINYRRDKENTEVEEKTFDSEQGENFVGAAISQAHSKFFFS